MRQNHLESGVRDKFAQEFYHAREVCFVFVLLRHVPIRDQTQFSLPLNNLLSNRPVVVRVGLRSYKVVVQSSVYYRLLNFIFFRTQQNDN